MIYPAMNGTLIGSNIMNIFVYANQVTFGFFGVFMVLSFFLVVLLGSLFMQLRFTARMRPEVSFVASSFATLGFAVLAQQVSGILNGFYFLIIIAMTVISVIWLMMSNE